MKKPAPAAIDLDQTTLTAAQFESQVTAGAGTSEIKKMSINVRDK